jgi:hypothetical protein
MSGQLDMVNCATDGLENNEPQMAERTESLVVTHGSCLKQVEENREIPTVDKIPVKALRKPTSFEDQPPNLHAFVTVAVSGSKDVVKVALPTAFRKTTEATTPTASGSFHKYLSSQLKANVTAVYYPVRGDRLRAGLGSCVLKKFVEDAGPTQYPFVGGMRLVLCLNNDELQGEELLMQGDATCQGGGCCVM